MDAIQQMGLSLLIAFQSVPGLAGVMTALTFLGQEEFFLFFMPFVFWCVDAGFGARLAIVLVSSKGLGDLLKVAFHLPRPYWVDTRVRALAEETSYGLPSAHALSATAVWGLVAVQLRRAWVATLLIVLIVLISVSRWYLGMHFPLDTLGGWLAGALLLWAFLRFERPALARLRAMGPAQQVGIAFAVSMGYLALCALALWAAGAPDPSSWTTMALANGGVAPAPRSPQDMVTSAAMLFGAGAGIALGARYARFDARGPWARRAARFALGMAGVLLIWGGLKAIFPAGDAAPALVLRYVRYTLALLWVAYLAPWIFIRLQLAEPRADALASRALAPAL